MAKEKMVTRTMKTTTITAMCVDTDTGEVFNGTVTVAGDIKTEKMQEKLFNEYYNAPESIKEYKAVKIVDVKVDSAIMGMTESEFLTHAVEITK